MFKQIDDLLNGITMYRLMFFGLMIGAVLSILFSLFGWLSFSPFQMIGSLFILILVSFISNLVFGKLTKAAMNAESTIITALLLFFVFAPTVLTVRDALMLALGAVIAQASKYVLAIGRKHVFNPVAISAVILDLMGISIATWWIATPKLLFVVLVFGLMVVRKIRRFEEVGAFILGAVVVSFLRGVSISSLFLSWPLVFFATLMLTEPRTAPAMKKEQIIYGFGVGALFSSMLLLGPVSVTPELALVIGNLYAYIVSSKQVLRLKLKTMTQETAQICDFAFTSDQPLKFQPGQYLEWTLPLQKTDSRGNRRYFTITSAPSDEEVHLGVRLDPEHASDFKKQLLAMKPGDELIASHLAGGFTLPKDATKKMVWIAGGIGVTPFRSMVRELANTKQTRDADLFYCANSEADFAYQTELNQLCQQIGSKLICVVAKPTPTWTGKSGFLTKELIESEVPDYLTRIFYFSGPPMMVQNYVKLVESMGVPKKQIKTDYFPGF